MAESALQTETVSAAAAQRTLARPASVEGVGLHTGQSAKVTFCPAPTDAGIVFVRTDLPGQPEVRAQIASIMDAARAPRRTALVAGTAEVHTVEHAMAALWGLGVSNARVEISGPEVPGLDGSAQPFIAACKAAGLVEQDRPRKTFTLREPIWIETDGEAAIAALPHPEFRISYTLSYDHPQLRAQFAYFNGHPVNAFEQHIAPARTFCLEHEAEQLRQYGLGKGANYDNTLVVGAQGVIQNRLRFEDEFVRHKVLDLIGDLYLLGVTLRAHVIALKSGHSLNLKLLRKLQWAMERARDGALCSTAPAVFQGRELDINAIRQILPHRYPFLLVDRILEVVVDQRAVGLKNVTANEPFFQGHFPNRPVMPGVLLVEAMAQVGGVLILNKQENLGKYVYFMSADRVKFRKAVIPGDQVILTANVERFRGKTGFVKATATVDGKIAAEANLGFALVDGDTQ